MTTTTADPGDLAHAREAQRAIPAQTSRSLRRWNRGLTFAHGIQFLAMIAISTTAVVFAPVVPTVRPIIEGGQFTGVEPSSVTLFSIPLAYVIANVQYALDGIGQLPAAAQASSDGPDAREQRERVSHRSRLKQLEHGHDISDYCHTCSL